LDGIFHRKDGIIELTALQQHGEPVRLKKAGNKWVLASNPNMELISQRGFAILLQSEENSGLGNIPISGVENPMGSWTKYLAFKENTSNLSAQNFLFLIPEEDQDGDEARTFFKDDHKAKDADPGTFELFGQTEPSKLSLDADTLTVQSHFLRWSQGNVGRCGEFTVQESDSKAMTRTALALVARAMPEKNYTRALGFLNAIPNGIMFGKGDEGEVIRRIFFDIIMYDFDATPRAAHMHMQLLLKWLQIDTTVSRFISKFVQNDRRSGREFSVQEFADIVNVKFVKASREKAFYPQIFDLTHLQKTALLEKLKGEYQRLFLTSPIKVRVDQQLAIGESIETRNHTNGMAASVVARGEIGEIDAVSDGERRAFDILKEKFSLLNPRPSAVDAGDLLRGEEDGSEFSFLGTEQRPADGGRTLEGEFDRYGEEVAAGKRKMLADEKFISRDGDLFNTEIPGEI
jgi:hypothetical protein